MTNSDLVRKRASRLGDALGTVTLLRDRNAVIRCTSLLMEVAKTEVIGLGRTCAWIDIPVFHHAAVIARDRGVSFKVVVFFEGDARIHAATWRSFGAEVRYYENGPMRVALYDTTDAILAFPRDVVDLGSKREYTGLYLRDPEVVKEIHDYATLILAAGNREDYPKALEQWFTNLAGRIGLN